MLQEVKNLQDKAVNDLLNFSIYNSKITFKAPTGSGKTFIMAKFMDKCLSKSNNIIFIVSSLSKARLAEQNYSKFIEYCYKGYLKHLVPYLITSDDSSESALYIPCDKNVYVLPRDLYKNKSKLKNQQALKRFLEEITKTENKKIYVIRDESHIATKNLDELNSYFDKIIDISATPKNKPDIELQEVDAIQSYLIKNVEYKSKNTYNDDEFSIDSPQFQELCVALDLFKKIKSKYLKFNIKPCFIIQISNKDKGAEQLSEIKYLLSSFKQYQDLKWISIGEDPRLCDTNDQLIKSEPSKWEKYAIKDDSLIDIIIFKMKITEGWDIPRANMLFQIRDSQSKQLDEQVIGRIRRNPKLLSFENIQDLDDIKLLTTAYVWGVKEENNENSIIEVNLKGKVPNEVLDIKNEVQNEIKLNITKLQDNVVTEQSDFNIKEYLQKQTKPIAYKSIFELYEDLSSSDNKIQKECFNYINENKDDPYTAFFGFANNLKIIKTNVTKILKDYINSIEVVKTSSLEPLQVSLPFNSFYIKHPEFSLTVKNSIWNNNDAVGNFTLDSKAEVLWLNNMLSDFKIKKIPFNKEEEIYLIGKNYLPNSEIKYEYYSNDGRHFSYPDFILKNEKNEYFLFEVKSVNSSNAQSFDSTEYIEKIKTLKQVYFAISAKVSHYFCLPIQNGNTWTIDCFYDGKYYKLDYSNFKKVVNGNLEISAFNYSSDI